jgi:hypothetical protein
MVGIAAGAAGAVSLAVTMLQWWTHGMPLPLGADAGVIVSEGAVFVGGKDRGRVYKFDYEGRLLAYKSIGGQPISISARGDRVAVTYNSRTSDVPEPQFRITNAPGVTARVVRTWWGHPMLEVVGPEWVKRSELQRWYVTAVQIPYPAGLWFAAAIASGMLAGWARERRLGERNCVGEPERFMT